MPRGGYRPGAGRKKGAVNKATRERQEVALRALREGTTPLDVILEAMKSAYEKGGAEAAVPFAKEAAPYVHPKLSNVDANVNGVIGQYAAQPIPVEQRHSDTVASTNGSAVNGHST